jgi:hypothetical protein
MPKRFLKRYLLRPGVVTPVFSAVRRLRQEDKEFKAS